MERTQYSPSTFPGDSLACQPCLRSNNLSVSRPNFYPGVESWSDNRLAAPSPPSPLLLTFSSFSLYHVTKVLPYSSYYLKHYRRMIQLNTFSQPVLHYSGSVWLLSTEAQKAAFRVPPRCAVSLLSVISAYFEAFSACLPFPSLLSLFSLLCI